MYLGDANFLASDNSLMQAVQMNIQTVTILSIVPNGDGTATVTCQGVPATRTWCRPLRPSPVDHLGKRLHQLPPDYIDGQWTYVDDMTQHPQRFFRAALP